MRKLRFDCMCEYQTIALYVNTIPFKKVGKNLRWLIYIVK